mmetsp:Transcript_62878/g.116908  ORF Transcript_62878/g.116908 Transcript_62878/m.116908 type:complete len:241 (-) Transcript_62878:437-1159(-)
MRLLAEHGLQGIYLSLDAGVCCLSVSAQCWILGILCIIGGASWQETSLNHLNHGLHFDAHGCDIALIHHLLACLALLVGEHLKVIEHFHVLCRCKLCDRQRCVVQVWQSPLLRFLRPLRTVAISSEDHIAILLVDLSYSIPVGHTTFDQAGQVSHTSRHDGVADGDREGAILRRADRTELEAVSTEGEGRGSVTILHTAGSTHCSCCFWIGQLLLSLVSEERGALDDVVHMLLEASARIQ